MKFRVAITASLVLGLNIASVAHASVTPLTISRSALSTTNSHGQSLWYASITNHENQPITLVSLRTSVSGMVMFFTGTGQCTHSDQIRWDALLTVPANQTLTMGCRLDGVLISQLSHPLRHGQSVAFTLQWMDTTVHESNFTTSVSRPAIAWLATAHMSM